MKGKKINYRSLSIRLLIWFFASLLSEFGIGCYYACGLGTDPVSVFVDGVHNICGLSYGNISTICNIILLILIIIFERRYLGIGTIISTFISGPLIDVFETLMRTNFPVDSTSIGIRFVIVLIGLITTSVGYALTIACDMGIGAFQFIPLFIEDKTPIKLNVAQTISDTIFFAIGVILGGVTGIGTVLGVLCTGFIMGYVLDKVQKPIENLGPMIE